MAPRRLILGYDLTYESDDCSGDCSAPLPPSFHLDNLALGAVCLMVSVFFFAFIYCVVSNRRRRAFASETGDYPDSDRDHTLLHIRTVGLDAAAIASIAVFEYSSLDALDAAAADCSVCLAEFDDGDRVRLLPKCSHVFHVPCIDTWLQAQANCPLCRVPVVPLPMAENSSPLGAPDNASLSAGSDPQLSFEGEDDLEAVVSVDASAVSSHLLSPVPSGLEEGGSVVETEGSFREEEKEPGVAGEQSTNAKGKLGSSPKATDKSSGSGRRFFFSKNGRSRSMVLPL